MATKDLNEIIKMANVDPALLTSSEISRLARECILCQEKFRLFEGDAYKDTIRFRYSILAIIVLILSISSLIAYNIYLPNEEESVVYTGCSQEIYSDMKNTINNYAKLCEYKEVY